LEIQVLILWAAQNNFLDDVPVDKVKDFQARLTDFIQTRQAPLLLKIRTEKAISELIGTELKAAVAEFKQTFR
jgi:F-type H+-transporting ATPase subunit alpha